MTLSASKIEGVRKIIAHLTSICDKRRHDRRVKNGSKSSKVIMDKVKVHSDVILCQDNIANHQVWDRVDGNNASVGVSPGEKLFDDRAIAIATLSRRRSHDEQAPLSAHSLVAPEGTIID